MTSMSSIAVLVLTWENPAWKTKIGSHFNRIAWWLKVDESLKRCQIDTNQNSKQLMSFLKYDINYKIN